MKAYYNEINSFCAEWLRNLMNSSLIVEGDIDTRKVQEIDPEDLVHYQQVHLFAGIGIWSHAARLAGIRDDLPIWTGSCPCQPFSTSGKQKGFDDERHLWPSFYRLVKARRPFLIFGEQVASKLGEQWLETITVDLDKEGYVVGSSILCASAYGYPARKRIYFAAYSDRNSERNGSLNAKMASISKTKKLASFSWRDLRRVGKACYGNRTKMGRLRAYGNSLNVPSASSFIQAAIQTMP